MSSYIIPLGQSSRLQFATDKNQVVVMAEFRDGDWWIGEAETCLTPTEVRGLANALNRMADNIDTRNDT